MVGVVAAAARSRKDALLAVEMRFRDFGWYFHFKALAFVAPLVTYLVVFYAYPLAENVSMSLHRFTRATYVTGEAPFAGTDIYREVYQRLLEAGAGREADQDAVVEERRRERRHAPAQGIGQRFGDDDVDTFAALQHIDVDLNYAHFLQHLRPIGIGQGEFCPPSGERRERIVDRAHGLSAAVGSQQAEDLPAGYFKADIVESLTVSVGK